MQWKNYWLVELHWSKTFYKQNCLFRSGHIQTSKFYVYACFSSTAVEGVLHHPGSRSQTPQGFDHPTEIFLVVYALMHSVWKIHSNNGIRHLLLLSVTVSKMWKIIDAQTHQHLERKSEHNSMELYYNKKWWQIFTEMTNKVQNKN